MHQGTSPEEILIMEDIWKRFPGVIALKGVSISVRRGEILGLVGENGAGKSTLLKILFGILRADKGKVIWKGREIRAENPHHALTMGISYVPQETLLLPNLSVAENIFLGYKLHKGSELVRYNDMFNEAKKYLSIVGLDHLDPRIRVKGLGVATQQLIMIARALAFKAELIVLDEPTSALGPWEVERLLDLMLKLRESGISSIFVSHRLEEVLRVADRIAVLRDGMKVAEFDNRDRMVPLLDVVKVMIAREIREFYPKEVVSIGEPMLEVRNLRGGRVRGASFYVRRGEILGIFGLLGSGRSTLAQILAGIKQRDAGEIVLEGREIDIRRPIDALNAGIAYVPEDRRLQGLVFLMSVKDNITLPIIDKLSKTPSLNVFSIIDMSRERQLTSKYIEYLRISPPDPYRKTMFLSGGNQQKVVLAKVLATKAKVLILDEPTRGIDVGAKVEIRRLMNEMVREGKSVILISSELPEILGMSDRILVMSDGVIVGEFQRGEALPEKIMELAVRRAS